MNSFRTLRIYGNKDPDTAYTVSVNGQFLDLDTDELYSFVTSTEFHGSYHVIISVTQGSLTLTRVTATYPALFNGIEGSATMIQPIAEPVAVIKDSSISTLQFPITISSGQTLDYEHLMFNGPTRWRINIEDHNVVPGVNIFIGNLLTEDITQGITDVQFDYEYTVRPNDINSKHDLEELKLLVLNNKR